jgi:hypothetical protein
VVVGTTSDRPIDAVEVELGAPRHSSLILEVQVSDQVWAVAEVAAPDAVAVAAPVASVEDERFALPVDDAVVEAIPTCRCCYRSQTRVPLLVLAVIGGAAGSHYRL